MSENGRQTRGEDRKHKRQMKRFLSIRKNVGKTQQIGPVEDPRRHLSLNEILNLSRALALRGRRERRRGAYKSQRRIQTHELNDAEKHSLKKYRPEARGDSERKNNDERPQKNDTRIQTAAWPPPSLVWTTRHRCCGEMEIRLLSLLCF